MRWARSPVSSRGAVRAASMRAIVAGRPARGDERGPRPAGVDRPLWHTLAPQMRALRWTAAGAGPALLLCLVLVASSDAGPAAGPSARAAIVAGSLGNQGALT